MTKPAPQPRRERQEQVEPHQRHPDRHNRRCRIIRQDTSQQRRLPLHQPQPQGQQDQATSNPEGLQADPKEPKQA